MKAGKKALVKKLGITASVVLLLLAIGTYVGVAIYFEDHFFYHTTIGGEDYSYKTPVEAEYLMYESLSGYALEITGREGVRDVLLPEEIELQFIFGDALWKIKQEQKPALWIMGFIKGYDYEMPRIAYFDETAFQGRIDRLAFFERKNVRAPKDAYITYSDDQGRYDIVEATAGTEMVREKAEAEIREALLDLEPGLDLEEAGCYKVAEVNGGNENLRAALDLANRYISACIVYDWNGNRVVVDADVIRKWINVEKDNVELDEKKIEKFLSRQADEYDTYGKSKVFHTTDGREIDLHNGVFGWLTDLEAETPVLVNAVKNGETMERQPVHTDKEKASWQVSIDDTYVEIDLGRQHLYLYVDGEIVLESDFVSGNASRGWSTPAGVFGLTYKTRNAVLRGENYATPVSYWMPFNGNIGMHDATWRSSFGGDIYRTNGSHGCINLPYEKAQIIYEYVYTGFPVVCYY